MEENKTRVRVGRVWGSGCCWSSRQGHISLKREYLSKVLERVRERAMRISGERVFSKCKGPVAGEVWLIGNSERASVTTVEWSMGSQWELRSESLCKAGLHRASEAIVGTLAICSVLLTHNCILWSKTVAQDPGILDSGKRRKGTVGHDPFFKAQAGSWTHHFLAHPVRISPIHGHTWLQGRLGSKSHSSRPRIQIKLTESVGERLSKMVTASATNPFFEKGIYEIRNLIIPLIMKSTFH